MNNIKNYLLNHWNWTNIFFALITFAVFFFGYRSVDYSKKTSEHITKHIDSLLTKQDPLIEILKATNDSTLVINTEELSNYSLKKDIIAVQKESLVLKKVIEEKSDNWISNIFSLWSLLALAIGSIAGFIGLKQTVNEKVIDQISKFTNKEKKYIGVSLEEFLRHRNLKLNAKILVITGEKEKNKNLVKFKKVMNLFPNTKYKYDIILEGFKKPELRAEIKKYDLIVLEDQIEGTKWNLAFDNPFHKLRKLESAVTCFKAKLNSIDETNAQSKVFIANKIKSLEAQITKLGLSGNKREWYDKIIEKNKENPEYNENLKDNINLQGFKDELKECKEKTCADKDFEKIEELEFKIKIISYFETKNFIKFIRENAENDIYTFYFGDYIDPNKLSENTKYHLSFSNAPSQLYGNLMNLLKFKNELEKNN